MIEPTQAQVDAALKVLARLLGADNWEPLVRRAVRAALNAETGNVDQVIDGVGWAEAAFAEIPRHAQYTDISAANYLQRLSVVEFGGWPESDFANKRAGTCHV